MLVKYEDLVENIMDVTEILYRFSEIPFDDSVRNHITELTNGSSNFKTFGVKRPASFDHNHWKEELEVEKIKEIEKYCDSFLNKLQYAKFEK